MKVTRTRKPVVAALFVLLGAYSCSITSTKQQDQSSVTTKGEVSPVFSMSMGDLSVKPKSVLLDHKYFRVMYDPKYRLARYVRYVGTAEHLRKNNAKRTNKFFPDPILKKLGLEPVQKKDYLHSGYDQGHMAPSGDFTWAQDVNNETFVLSNMAPQKPKLNRDAWRQLEAHVHKWICGEGRVVVITGPLLEEGLPTLKSGLPVPNEFFKILIDDTPPRKVVAFIFKQTDMGDVYNERVVEVKALEKRIGESFENEVSEPERKIFSHPANLAEWKEGECVS
jgi:endonuclease G